MDFLVFVVFIPLAFLGVVMVGILLTETAAWDDLRSRFWPNVVHKAEHERQAEILRRTAQIIREHGLPRSEATNQAEREYRAEMKAATP